MLSRLLFCGLFFACLVLGSVSTSTSTSTSTSADGGPSVYSVAGEGTPDLDTFARPVASSRVWLSQGNTRFCVGVAALNQLRARGVNVSFSWLVAAYRAKYPDDDWMRVEKLVGVFAERGVVLVSRNFVLSGYRWSNMSYAAWERQTADYVRRNVPVDVYPWLTNQGEYLVVTVLAVGASFDWVHFVDPRDGREYIAPASLFWRSVLGPNDFDGGYVNLWRRGN